MPEGIRPERAAECDGLSTWIARYSFSTVPVGRPFSFRADFDGAVPGLKAWAVLLNRFAVRSNRLVYKDQGFIAPVSQGGLAIESLKSKTGRR